MGLGVAYGIWGASGVTLTAVLAAFLFGEDLNAVMGLGVALVAAGVFLVQTDTQRAQREPVSDSDSRAAAPPRPPGVRAPGGNREERREGKRERGGGRRDVRKEEAEHRKESWRRE